MAKQVKPGEHKETNSTANKPSKGHDDVSLVIQVQYKIPKEERDNYAAPNYHAADCLRQDVERWKRGEIPLAELMWNPYASITSVDVTR